MMGMIETKTFKSGNSVALRLPKSLGIDAGVAVTIEQVGDAIRVRRSPDADDGRERVRRLIEALEAIGPVGEIGQREPIDFPDRPNLY